VSSVLSRPTNREAEYAECARLIPGEVPAYRSTLRKPPRSIGPRLAIDREAMPNEVLSESLFHTFAPHPFQNRTAQECIRSIGIDCALIALNWVCLGALLLPLGVVIPDARLFEFGPRSVVFVLGISLLNAALITLVAYTEGLYTSGRELALQTRSIGKAVLWGGLVMFLAYGMQGSHRAITGLIGLVSPAQLRVYVALEVGGPRNKRSVERLDERNVLIVGAGRVGRRVAAYLEVHPGCGRRICGFLDDDRPLGNDVIGRISDLALMARRGFVDEVILAAPRDAELAARVFREAKGLRLDLEIIPELFGCDPAEQEIEYVGGLPVICVHVEHLPAVGLVLKRMIDVIGATLGLIVISPILLAIALLVKMDSRGPVLYAANRAGRKGRPFRCYKFRSMVGDADKQKNLLRQKNQRSGPIFKVFDDPRITRVGRAFCAATASMSCRSFGTCSKVK
jgi:hypothetical protein